MQVIDLGGMRPKAKAVGRQRIATEKTQADALRLSAVPEHMAGNVARCSQALSYGPLTVTMSEIKNRRVGGFGWHNV